MKLPWTGFIVIFLVTLFVGIGIGVQTGQISNQQIGYDKGYIVGEDIGYAEGHSDGHKVGFSEAYVSGYLVGHIAGYKQGTWVREKEEAVLTDEVENTFTDELGDLEDELWSYNNDSSDSNAAITGGIVGIAVYIICSRFWWAKYWYP